MQSSIDSINKPQSITYLRRCKGRRIIQEEPSFLSFRPNGKVRAEKATFSVTKLHAVVVAHKPSYSCVTKHDEYNWSLYKVGECFLLCGKGQGELRSVYHEFWFSVFY